MVQLKLRTLNLPLIPLILFSEDLPGSFGRPAWLQNVQNEIKAAKTSIGIVDLSSQSVFQLTVSDKANFIIAKLMYKFEVLRLPCLSASVGIFNRLG